MDIHEVKELFAKLHPEETMHIKKYSQNSKEYLMASCVWRGFKSALIHSKLLEVST